MNWIGWSLVVVMQVMSFGSLMEVESASVELSEVTLEGLVMAMEGFGWKDAIERALDGAQYIRDAKLLVETAVYLDDEVQGAFVLKHVEAGGERDRVVLQVWNPLTSKRMLRCLLDHFDGCYLEDGEMRVLMVEKFKSLIYGGEVKKLEVLLGHPVIRRLFLEDVSGCGLAWQEDGMRMCHLVSSLRMVEWFLGKGADFRMQLGGKCQLERLIEFVGNNNVDSPIKREAIGAIAGLLLIHDGHVNANLDVVREVGRIKEELFVPVETFVGLGEDEGSWVSVLPGEIRKLVWVELMAEQRRMAFQLIRDKYANFE